MNDRPGIILVPVDGSDGAAAAARFAAGLAGGLGVPLRLLFAFPEDALDLLGVPTESVTADQMEAYSPARFSTLRDARARQVLDRARQAIEAPGLAIEEQVLVGEAASAILAHAATADDPMIVMGSRGLSRLSEMLMGSVSHRVMHHARCPVTIVR